MGKWNALAMSKKLIALAAIFALGTLAALPATATASLAGARCSPAGKVLKSGTTSYQCTLVNKKLVWVAKGKVASVPSKTTTASTSPKPQTITSTYPNSIPLLTGPTMGGFTSTSVLPVTVTATPPEICLLDGNGLHVSATGKCTLTANQPGNSSFSLASITQTISIVAPKLSEVDAQLSAAQQITLVGKNQIYKAELFEFQVLSITDNVDVTLCADSVANQGCFLDSYGESKVDPKSAERYVKIHVKVHDTGTELLGPTFYFRLIVGNKIYDALTNVTLPALNDLTIQPEETAEGDYYLSVPKDVKLDQAYLLFDDSFVSADQAVIFTL